MRIIKAVATLFAVELIFPKSYYSRPVFWVLKSLVTWASMFDNGIVGDIVMKEVVLCSVEYQRHH